MSKATLPVIAAAIAFAGIGALGIFTAGSSPPLPEAILGTWEVWCRTDDEATHTCLGQEDMAMYKTFEAGGRLRAGSRKGTSMDGRWSLQGNELTLEFDGGAGFDLTEHYRARIEDDRLVLWNSGHGFGSVSGRQGSSFEADDSPVTEGGAVESKLAGLRYSVDLPAGYRLIRDDNRKQRWGPESGTGFTVSLSVSERAQTKEGGVFVTPPCNPYDYGGVLGTGSEIDGVERDTSIGTSLCIDETTLVMMCSAEHTRGYLQDNEKDAALALCKTLKVPPPSG